MERKEGSSMRDWMRLALALMALLPVTPLRAAPADMVRGGGFEEEGARGIGREWASESYGAATIQFGVVEDRAQSGKRCQHIHVEGYKDGGAQIRQLGFPLTAGQKYEITLWIRGNLDAPVTVGFRKAEKPYTYYLRDQVHATSGWQKFTISGVAAESDANAGLYLFFAGNGDLWIDNVSAHAVGEEKAAP
jgi:hypothetical protein